MPGRPSATAPADAAMTIKQAAITHAGQAGLDQDDSIDASRPAPIITTANAKQMVRSQAAIVIAQPPRGGCRKASEIHMPPILPCSVIELENEQ